MSALSDFFKRVKKEMRMGGRVFRHRDPSDGISYNTINENRQISKKIWDVDIARSPVVVKEIHSHVNVHNVARKANSHRSMVDYRQSKFRGRTGVW